MLAKSVDALVIPCLEGRLDRDPSVMIVEVQPMWSQGWLVRVIFHLAGKCAIKSLESHAAVRFDDGSECAARHPGDIAVDGDDCLGRLGDREPFGDRNHVTAHTASHTDRGGAPSLDAQYLARQRQRHS